MSGKSPAKVEHPKAPIKTILEMKYATLKITIEALDAESQAGGLMIAGHIAEQCKIIFSWGFPKMSYIKIVQCPKCKQESPLLIVDALDVSCPKCGASLKGDMEF